MLEDIKILKPNKFEGKVQKVPLLSLETRAEGVFNLYHNYYMFNVANADVPFKSTYTGFFGLGPSKSFDEESREKWSVAYHMKKQNKISELVTSLYSCEETIKDDALQLKFGGWSKEEAGITDDVTKIDISSKYTWKVDIAGYSIHNEAYVKQ